MDLSAVIFVVLALAWAVYLIPKALKHHDEMASDRLVEGHSERVRILHRHRTPAGSDEQATDEVEVVVETTPAPVQQNERVRPAAAPRPALAPTSRSAARRRRRVLAVLLCSLAVVAGLALASVVPWWSTAVPASLVVAFLVVARLSVRRAQRTRRTLRVVAPVDAAPSTAPSTTPPTTPAPTPAATLEGPAQVPATVGATQRPAPTTADLLDRLGDGDTDREQVEAVLADDGSLWDPLPLTLPTYVNKARARRTVRTIELTGLTSSGHDDADSTLAREAAESEAHTEASTEETPSGVRRVAGA